jgi:glycolate oxidase subunit GlcD
MTSNHKKFLFELRTLTGPDWVKTDPADLEFYGKDWTKVIPPRPLAIVLPVSVDQLVKIVKLANHHELAIVPSGGRTGLSGGAVASNGELVIAFDRMNKILNFDPTDRQAVCQPGVITEQLQQFAKDNDLFYPVDFASSGSSQIGGNVATNAGGIKVIRYGMTRNWVQGLKVVTGNGDLLELNRGLVKNATGYDLRHLFIGSEGTLGLIAEVTVNLCNKPFDPTVLILGVENISVTINILQSFQNKLNLSAFEFFSDKALAHVIGEKGLQRPFKSECEFYVLIEFEKFSENDMETAMGLFESCMESGWVVDGTVSQNLTQAESIWKLREDISETISKFTPYKNDISVKVSKVPQFLQEVDELVTRAYPDFEIIWFGHIGDGNVHLNILKPDALAKEEFFEKCSKVSNEIFEIVRKYGGSISAEHGVGLLKKPYLHYSRSPAEIAYLKALKAVFDPKNIMNPGKLFD